MRDLYPAKQSVILEPTTWDNLGDILIHSVDSSTDFIELPLTESEIDSYMLVVDFQHHRQTGYWFNAYESSKPHRFVGSGQVFYINGGPVAELGYWVVEAYRRQGYGSAILTALEHAAVNDFPQLERTELHIDHRNLASIALGESMGYERLSDPDASDHQVLWKIPA